MDIVRPYSGFNGMEGYDALRSDRHYQELRDFIPSLKDAYKDRDTIFEFGQKHYSLLKEDDVSFSLLEPLQNEEWSRARYAKTFGVKEAFSNLGPRWARGFGLYLGLLSKGVREEVVNFLQKCRVFEFKSAHYLIKLLGMIGKAFKKHRDVLSPNWDKFVNLDTLGGYAPRMDFRGEVDATRDWISGDTLHTYLGSEKMFLERFERHILEFFEKAPNISSANEGGLTIEEWAMNPGRWARSGSSSERSQIYYTWNGKKYRTGKVKWSTALNWPVEKVVSILKESNPANLIPYATSVQKRETKKSRMVIASDIYTYLRMSYISHWVESALHKHPNTTLFMDLNQQVQMWESLARSCRTPTIKVPIDQDQFDHNPNRRMDAAFFNALEKFIDRHAVGAVKRDLLYVLCRLRVGFLSPERYVLVRKGNIVVRVVDSKGVDSGLRWTSLLDTADNYGEVMTAVDYVRSRGIRVDIVSLVLQGDDIRLEVLSVASAIAIVEALRLMNFPINEKKFFIAPYNDEFLRMVIKPNSVYGYPARTINSLLWRNPVSRDPPSGYLRALEQVKSWLKCFNRGLDFNKVLKHMLIDVSRANNISKYKVKRLLYTPSSLGGFGVFPYDGGRLFKFTAGVDRKVVSYDLDQIHGLEKEFESVGIKGEDKRWVKYQVASSVLPAPRVTPQIEGGGTEEIAMVPAVKWYAYPSASGLPTKARVNREIPLTIADHLLRLAKKKKDYEWIQNVFIDPVDRMLSNKIHQKGGRGVWLDWIEGKLPFATPNIPGWSDSVISLNHTLLVNYTWTRLASRHSFNKRDLLRAAIMIEFELRKVLDMKDIRIGG